MLEFNANMNAIGVVVFVSSFCYMVLRLLEVRQFL